ncbi:MAG: hypothetical protein K6T66_00975 [Peptococcaceae bacterium]|nr:hypothetical protein [Peptococcaceae bacterium]
MGKKDDFRLVKMALSGRDYAVMHGRNPWMPMWWSAALPGLGHLCQGAYLRGLLLMSWEILVNIKARLNQAIVYTFTGQFGKAGETLDREWALFYGVIFFFAIYDSYRISVEVNMLVRLERAQPRRYFKILQMSTGGLNYLGRGNPWAAAAWSALLSGFGQMYNGRAFKAFILLGWTVAIIWLARLNDGIICTFTGDFRRAKEVVDYQWVLFFPSIYLYSVWDAYSDAVEANKLFAEAQKNHLRKKYGAGFPHGL